jgi:REP element-mobilizing transposase RayT
MDLIDEEIESSLYRYLMNKCGEKRCWIEKIGGTANHIHILVRLRPAVSVSEFVQLIKGSSSHYISQILCPGSCFKWQGGYAAFSVSPQLIPSIKKYITNQKDHHKDETLNKNWEL